MSYSGKTIHEAEIRASDCAQLEREQGRLEQLHDQLDRLNAYLRGSISEGSQIADRILGIQIQNQKDPNSDIQTCPTPPCDGALEILQQDIHNIEEAANRLDRLISRLSRL